MRVIVTGAAGFIGSWIAETLLSNGHEVLGIDCFVDYYPRSIKEENLRHLTEWASFKFVKVDLSETDGSQLKSWMAEYPFITHQAAQAGVRSSWGQHFDDYTRHNVLATQRLLEAAKEVAIRRFVYSSSSSVYGRVEAFPLREDGPTLPMSPYGVTKLAAEHLLGLYHANFGVPGVSLRYFTVYGPRQRPDMAFNRLARSLIRGEPFPLYGDGSQSRSFTYVTDVVEANLAALFKDPDPADSFLGQPINVGGGTRASMKQVIKLAEQLVGREVILQSLNSQKGDVDRTEADLSRARNWLGYEPKVSLEDGLEAEIEWMRKREDNG